MKCGGQGADVGAVDSGSDAPLQAPEEAAPEAASPPAEDAIDPRDIEEEKLPFHKHPRWQKVVGENQTMREKLTQYEQQVKSAEQAMNLDRWLREDFAGAMKFLNEQYELHKGQNAPPEDEFAEFDPKAAEVLRAAREAEKRLNDREKTWQQREAEAQERAKVDNQKSIDTEFDSLAAKEGFIGKDGKCDEKFMRLLATATWTEMTALARNPEMPTRQELQAAFKIVSEGLKAAERTGAKKTVAPSVPPSGSNRGTVPSGKTTSTDTERIRGIVDLLGG